MKVQCLPLVLHVDITGKPQQWITYKKAAIFYTKCLIAWSAATQTFILHGGINKFANKQSILTINTIVATKQKYKTNKKHKNEKITNTILFHRDNYICAYCGNRFNDKVLTRDHIIPIKKGGTNTWLNIITSCGPCNHKKDNKTPKQANMPLLYNPYTPTIPELLIFQNKNILIDQMQFLLKNIPKKVNY